MEAAIGQRVPFPLHQKKSKAMVGLDQITLNLVRPSRLSPVSFRGAQEASEEEDLTLDTIITHQSRP
jgi:hypothetical protein